MKTIIPSKKWSILILCLLLCWFTTAPTIAGILQGTVKNKSGQLKSYVRVEIGGQQSKTVFTDENGKFITPLQEGSYTIGIVQRNKRMNFRVDIPQGNELIEIQFILKR
jgi:hypothetical protein